jgi:hypothetical protein
MCEVNDQDPTGRRIHQCFHNISNILKCDVDLVADIIEMWEEERSPKPNDYPVNQLDCNHPLDFSEWSCTIGDTAVSFRCPICQKTIQSTHIENCSAEIRFAYFKMMDNNK